MTMSNQVKLCFRAYCIFCMVVAFSYLPPVLIEEYYPAAAPVAAVFVWITDTGSHALAAVMSCLALAMLGLLMKDAYKGLARALSTNPTGPIALEDGTAVPTATGSTPNAGVETPQRTQLPLTATRKLLLLFIFSSFCTQQFFLSGVVSVNRPLLQNIGAALMFILRGFQVLQLLYPAFMIVVAITMIKKRRAERAAAQAGNAQVPGVDVGDEKAVDVEEKIEASVV
ncbi:hypothetical protein MSAN_00843100 [Mycena sanguinolenta]|uniref:Uncharacterized protein n=1 Tax=Mycena sanguinolenta TaxID=230812 RepID=A0A8H6YZU9_9AGAR|nr:hypothetical protein MSAN_00843100 [Mycena sanguinolenta]